MPVLWLQRNHFTPAADLTTLTHMTGGKDIWIAPLPKHGVTHINLQFKGGMMHESDGHHDTAECGAIDSEISPQPSTLRATPTGRCSPLNPLIS
eukprot:6078314-Amphidinium_carterae.3